MRFSSRAGDATKFEKIASPVREKNRSCSRGLKLFYLIRHLMRDFRIVNFKSYFIFYPSNGSHVESRGITFDCDYTDTGDSM